jgi:hypothetical protein
VPHEIVERRLAPYEILGEQKIVDADRDERRRVDDKRRPDILFESTVRRDDDRLVT